MRITALCLLLAAALPLRSVFSEKLILTGNKDYPPLIFLENDQAKGIYPDVIRALNARGFDAEIRLMEWQAAQEAVLDGSAHAIIGMAILEERKKIFDFSDPLLPHEFAIFVRRGDLSIQSFADLKNKTVGAVASSVPIVQLRSEPGIRFQNIASYKDGFRLLKEGKVAALVLNEWVAAYTLFHNGIDNIVPVKPASVIGGPAGFGVRKGNAAVVARINAALKDLKQSGQLDEILERWSPHSMIIWPQAKLRNLTLFYIQVGAAITLVLLLIWVALMWRSLRRARAAEGKLQESHELLEKLTDQAPGMIYQFKRFPDGRYALTYTSRAVEVLQEIPPEIAMTDFSLLEQRVHPDDKDRFVQSIQQSAENLTPWRLEYRMVLPRQGVRWRLGESHPQKLVDGTILWHGYLSDITEQKSREAQIAELSAKIIDLREKEHAEVSRELHDSVGQGLVLLKLHLESKLKLIPEADRAAFSELAEMIRQVLGTARDISRRLSPLHLKSLGIIAAIEDLCDQVRKGRNFKITVDMHDFAHCVSDDAAIQVYRIVQEALTNVLKHSNGDEIRIFTQTGEQSIRLIIADNGRNRIDDESSSPGIGLQIMRERARIIGSTFNFRSDETGARVEIELPKRFALAQGENAAG